MGRVNRKIEGAFVKLIGETNGITAYEAFLNRNNIENPTAQLKKYTKAYTDFITNQKLNLKRICLIEEIILQLRTRETVDDIKLSITNNYIYARCPYYRNDTTAKDVRVLVDSLTLYKVGTKKAVTPKTLFANQEFMEKATSKLKAAMSDIINKNIEKLNALDAKIEELNKPAEKATEAPVSNTKKAASKKAPASNTKKAASKKPAAKNPAEAPVSNTKKKVASKKRAAKKLETVEVAEEVLEAAE